MTLNGDSGLMKQNDISEDLLTDTIMEVEDSLDYLIRSINELRATLERMEVVQRILVDKIETLCDARWPSE